MVPPVRLFQAQFRPFRREAATGKAGVPGTVIRTSGTRGVSASPPRCCAALLRRVGGDFANELLLGGQRVLPNKALSNGFVFRHETLRSAFEAIL